jgi:hypothetical protein
MLQKCAVIEENDQVYGGNVNHIDKLYSLSTGYQGVMLFRCMTLLFSVNISTVLLLLLI